MNCQRLPFARLKRALNASSDLAALVQGVGLNRNRASMLTAAACFGLIASPAQAQTNPDAAPAAPVSPESTATAPTSDQVAADSTAAGNGDIIVTATRREESLSRVPLSITALTSETLEARVVTREQDLAALVPGLVVKNGQNQNQLSFTLRGQTLDPFSGASPAVLTYLNEVPFGGGNSATSFYDFSSVQVLKGPQGTLFGRNATGGAVLYTSTMPGEDFGGNLTIRGGMRNLLQVQGAIDIPIASDVLLVRIAGDYQRQDGYVRNRLAGGTLGNIDNASGRATIVFQPGSGIKNVTVLQYSKFGGNEAASQLYSYYKLGATNNGYTLTTTLDTVYGNGLFPGVGEGAPGRGTFPGAVAGYLAYQKSHPYDIYLSYDLPHDADNYFAQNTTTIDLNSSTTFKNIFGYQKSYARTPGILSGSPFASLDLYNSTGAFRGPPGGELFRNTSLSDEMQIQGEGFGGQLKYIVGGFYNYATREEGIPVIVGGELATPLGQVLYHTRNTDESRALYAQATYDLSDAIQGLSITAGGRYTWETVGQTPYADHVFATNFPYESRDLSAPSWNFNLQWQANSENQLYFTQRGSFRSGNFNGAVVPYNFVNFFENEYAHDFEVGYKYNGQIAGMRSHFNIALYDQIVSNAQHSLYAVVAGAPSAFTVNVPKAKVKGVEVDGDIVLVNWLKLGFSGAYTDAKYTENIVDLSRQTGVPGFTIPFDSYPDAPKFSGSLYADLTLPISERLGRTHFRVDSFSQTSSYFSNNNESITPGTKVKGYTTVAMRLGMEDIAGSGLSASAYAKNVFNRLYYQAGYVEGNSGGFNTVIVGEPRTVAAELTFKF